MVKYNNQEFPSLAEAQWAAFFTAEKWKWSYASQRQAFILDIKTPTLAIVTPADIPARLYAFVVNGKLPSWDKEILILGTKPFHDKYSCQLGLLGEPFHEQGKKGWDYWFAESPLMYCVECKKLSFYHAECSYHCRVSGCYDGDGHIGYLDGVELEKRWIDAQTKAGLLTAVKENRLKTTKVINYVADDKLELFQDNQASGTTNPIIWNNLRFRSKTEVKIAEALEKEKVLFFPNCKARLGFTERQNLEPDFLVCYKGKLGILEIDGSPYHPASRSAHEHKRDRLFLAHGISLVQRFDANECYENPENVVKQFLYLLTQNAR
ncbi:MAG: hypothetical protein PGMFKBFP_01859 [Anaerolineales bacterium]|nr:hypothetical protein [Anaerolineales bacterium]